MMTGAGVSIEPSGTRVRRLAALLAGTFMVVAGCSAGGRPAAVPPEEPAADPFVHVTVGASDSLGYGAARPAREAWPRVLTETTFPAGTVLKVVGQAGATVAMATASQVERALAASPDVITIWMAVNDLISLVEPAAYERDLDALLESLRPAGATIMVGNVPLVLLDRIVATQLSQAGGIVPLDRIRVVAQAYNEAIARVVAKHGAVLVDLQAAAAASTEDPATLLGPDRFHPSTRGHRLLAEAFAAAWTGPRSESEGIAPTPTTTATRRPEPERPAGAMETATADVS